MSASSKRKRCLVPAPVAKAPLPWLTITDSIRLSMLAHDIGAVRTDDGRIVLPGNKYKKTKKGKTK